MIPLVSELPGDAALSSCEVEVDDDHRFAGFDAYKQVIASEVDAVLLATPPHFRPAQFANPLEGASQQGPPKPRTVGVGGHQVHVAVGQHPLGQMLAANH